MKVYTCTDFEGHWPVGTAAVIIAENREQARKLLNSELRKQGLELGDATWIKIPQTKPIAIVLANGNY